MGGGTSYVPGTSYGGAAAQQKLTVMQALRALRKQADTNGDGMISDHEILDIFQGVKDQLNDSDFAGFLTLVGKLDGPVMCEDSGDCTSCTAVGNAGLCGWFAESQNANNNPFGGYATKSAGTCKFVDRSDNGAEDQPEEDDAADAADTFQLTTCSTQCTIKQPNINVQRVNDGGIFRGVGAGSN